MSTPLPKDTLAWLEQAAAAGLAEPLVLRHLLERVEALEADATEQSQSSSFCNEAIVRRLEALERRPILGINELATPTPGPTPVATDAEPPVSDSEMSAYNHRAAARFAILDRLEKAIDFNSHGWRLTSEGERWTRLMAEQGQDECEMGL